jgi:hypothetical protein
MSTSELARRMGTDEKSIRRMKDPSYTSNKIPPIIDALKILGVDCRLAVASAGPLNGWIGNSGIAPTHDDFPKTTDPDFHKIASNP